MPQGKATNSVMRLLGAATAVGVLVVAAYAGARGPHPNPLPLVGGGTLAGRDAGQLLGVAARPGEEIIHTPADAKVAGAPAVMPEGRGVGVRLRVVDAETGGPTPARLNVIGADGNFYEPDTAANPLAEYSLHRTGNREGKGPFRYYGWPFYTPCECSVRVPAGRVRVEAWKGFEYPPVQVSFEAAADRREPVTIRLERTATIEKAGYYSGDTHLHFTRDGSSATDGRLLDLLSAEDIRVGFILAMNDPRSYRPRMADQIWPQARMGDDSVLARGRQQMMSSQEYRAQTFGHILMLGGERLVEADGPATDPNNWPPFGLVADEIHRIGGYAFHAHGGYSAGIYADFAQRMTDGVELLQFAEYRGISLEGWYHMLNAGYRFPALGASDYPYCRALGDSRTYVRVEGELTARAWLEGAAAGRSFFTSGPLVRLEVDGRRPGDVIAPSQPQTLNVSVEIESPVVAVREVELLVNGRVAETRPLSGAGPWRVDWQYTVRGPAWLAVRASALDARGRQNAEAHTNPVYVEFAGRCPRLAASVDWLSTKLEGRIAYQQARDSPERERVLDYYERSRRALREPAEPAR